MVLKDLFVPFQRDYVKLVSQFKLETSVKDEVVEFAGGLHEVRWFTAFVLTCI